MKLAFFLLAASIFAFVWSLTGFNWGDPGQPNLFNIFMMGLSYILFIGAILRALYVEMQEKDYLGPKSDHPASYRYIQEARRV